MLSRKDLNSAELETVTLSESPTTLVPANGEVLTKEEASRRYTGHSLTWKTLRRSRIFPRVDQWSKTTTHQRWQTDRMQHGELRTDRCRWSIDKLFKLSYPTAPTSVPHEAVLRITASPHHQEVRVQEALREYGETRCVICQNGWKNLLCSRQGRTREFFS